MCEMLNFALNLRCVCVLQREEEKIVKFNITTWEASQYNGTVSENGTASPITIQPADVPRGPCWETMVGQVSVHVCVNSYALYDVTVILQCKVMGAHSDKYRIKECRFYQTYHSNVLLFKV